jgi:neutral ceramidase
MSYTVGAAKTDITYFRKNIGMHGYGRPFHKMKNIETQLYSRAVIIETEGNKIAFVNVELGMCSIYLKNGVIEMLKEEYPLLGFHDSNVMITAQHTHSAGGGFGQHYFYNVPIPGFKRDVYEHYRDGIVQSIVLADAYKKTAQLKFGVEEFNEHEEVAFNRSLDAYNENPEVKKKLKKEEWHLAADREMKLLNFEDKDGKIICSINWFGTHCTSISNDKYNICSDNKGYAALDLENYFYQKYKTKTICIFAQDACGDISPNFIFDKRKQWTRGKFRNDYESAKYTGNLQAKKAENITEKIIKNNSIKNKVKSIQTYVEFSEIHCDPVFTNGIKGCRTSQPCLGVSFLEGTVEGPGMLKPFGAVMKRALSIHKKNELKWAEERSKEYADYIHLKYSTQSPKHVVVEAIEGKMGWFDQGSQIPVPGVVEKTLHYIRNAEKQGKSAHKPWIISKLPLQIFILGELAIIGIPTEITTIAAQRLRKSILDDLESDGIKKIILSPYANAYAGYVTTPEEYLLQRYEGGHTLYGKWTLPAMQTAYKTLINKLKKGEKDDSRPFIFSDDMLWEYKK